MGNNEAVRMFFWNMETKEPLRDNEVTITFLKLNEDGEYAPKSPHAVGVKVQGFSMLSGIDKVIEKGEEANA